MHDKDTMPKSGGDVLPPIPPVLLRKLLGIVSQPDQWHCLTCGSTDDVYLCCSDAAVLCGGTEGHFHQYTSSGKAKTSLFLQLSAPHALVNAAGTEVAADTRAGSVATLRNKLTQLQSLGTGWTAAKGWAKLRMAVRIYGLTFFSLQAQRKRRQADLLASALRRWEHHDVYRAFSTWKTVTRQDRGAGQKRPRPGDAEAEEQAEDSPAAAAARSVLLTGDAAVDTLLRQGNFGRTGLRNLGNTCYMNSCLQALSNAPLFRRLIFRLAPPGDRSLDQLMAEVSIEGAPAKEQKGTGAKNGSKGKSGKAPAAASSKKGAGARGAASSAAEASAAPSASASASATATVALPGVVALAIPGLMIPIPRRTNSGLEEVMEDYLTNPSGTAVSAGAAASSFSASSTATAPQQALSSLTTPLTGEAHTVLSRLWGWQPLAVFSPEKFLKLMWRVLPSFSGFRQHDAEEFSRSLLNTFADELRAANITAAAVGMAALRGYTAAPAYAPVPGKGQPPLTPTQRACNPIASIFGGAIISSVTCQECGTVSSREEEFLGPLGVEIPYAHRTTVVPRIRQAASAGSGGSGGNGAGAAAAAAGRVSLEACLAQAYSRHEVMEGANAYACEVCKTKTTAVKTLRLSSDVPPTLILHIMRTDWARGGAKLQTIVTPVLDGLNLQPYIAGTQPQASPQAAQGAVSGAVCGKPPLSPPPVKRANVGAGAAAMPPAAPAAPVLYDLASVVTHVGRGIDQGHYFCYSRQATSLGGSSDGSTASGPGPAPSSAWFQLNDARVSQAREEEVMEACGYLLVYQRRR